MLLTLAQINGLVGDITGNTQRVITACQPYFEDPTPRLIAFPELTITGYPPEDLLLKPEMGARIEVALRTLQRALPAHLSVLVGAPEYGIEVLPYNALFLVNAQEVRLVSRKCALPNYSVFDEQRYFVPADHPSVIEWHGVRIGLLICEDVWCDEVADALAAQDPHWVVVANASPYHREQPLKRKELLTRRSMQFGAPIAYVNWIGGQDELVFDGRSCVIQPDGSLMSAAPAWEEYHLTVALADKQPKTKILDWPSIDQEADLYEALTTGVRDYVTKNGFEGAVIGLSGGIDSALTLAIAVDALGAERVQAVMMPYHYTSTMSLEDAETEARRLGVKYDVIPIAPMVEAFMQALSPMFSGTEVDVTEENLQARCRGVLLMAISNKFRRIVLTTGNKSEMAVGYATLYGDMAGGFCVLKDVFKTWVYRLARYRNEISPVIPERVIERPPSAELAPGQKDEDSLPPYTVLDAILTAYIEHDASMDEIIAQGFDAKTVERVMHLVDINEHKRRQAPPGVRVTARAFGRDRRYPITSGYRWQSRLIKELKDEKD